MDYMCTLAQFIILTLFFLDYLIKHWVHFLPSHLQANMKLMAELAKLKDELAKQKQPKKSSPKATPPGRRVRAPSPASESEDDAGEGDANPEHPQTDVGAGFGDESEEDEPSSEAAKNNRLRRLCEVKPSGRCHVPEEVHLRWKKGGAERMALPDEIENCGWDKDGKTIWKDLL